MKVVNQTSVWLFNQIGHSYRDKVEKYPAFSFNDAGTGNVSQTTVEAGRVHTGVPSHSLSVSDVDVDAVQTAVLV